MIHLEEDPQFSFEELEIGETFMKIGPGEDTFQKRNVFIKLDEKVYPKQHQDWDPNNVDAYNCVTLDGLLEYCESWEKVQMVELEVRRK